MDFWISWKNEHVNKSLAGECILLSLLVMCVLISAHELPQTLYSLCSLLSGVSHCTALQCSCCCFFTRALWRCSPAADHCCTVSRPPYRDFLCRVWTTQFTGCVIIQHTWTQSYRSNGGHHNEACYRLWRWALPPSAVLAVFLHLAKATVVQHSSSDEQLSVHVVDVFAVLLVCAS